ncbi:MAG TPA: N-acetyltransferase [Bryobacteraceae bacterium]|nr:N-acetyltransferase [Bryobacteraceae bacterium]
MAARLEPAPGTPRLVDLRHLRPVDLDPLLDEEVGAWRDLLDWDFGKSADLVRRFVDMQSLNGFALVEDGETAGYAYYVLEEHKGLIGDLFVRHAYSSMDNENLLLESVLDSLTRSHQVTRIESQLMMTQFTGWRPMPLPGFVNSFERNFMMLDMDRAILASPRRSPASGGVRVDNWSEQYQEPAAHLIAAAYRGHVDSLINDQYRTVAGARRFLYNIVQYPGCGTFFKPASVAAFDRTGHICGISLASLVMPQCGHVTQICVAPSVRGAGVGYEMLRQSLSLLRDAGCRKTSLTVTASNREAISLYEKVGFTTVRKFSAYVWEGF